MDPAVLRFGEYFLDEMKSSSCKVHSRLAGPRTVVKQTLFVVGRQLGEIEW